MAVDVDPDEIFIGSNLDEFNDPWNEDGLPPAARAACGALAAAAAGAAPAAGGGG